MDVANSKARSSKKIATVQVERICDGIFLTLGGRIALMNINVQAYGNAVHVPGASPWTVRATFALLFPKLSKEQEKMLLEQKLKQMNRAPPQKN